MLACLHEQYVFTTLSRRRIWIFLLALSASIAFVFPLVNWSAALDTPCFIPCKGSRSWRCEITKFSMACLNSKLPYGISMFVLSWCRVIYCMAIGCLMLAIIQRAQDPEKKRNLLVQFVSSKFWYFLAQVSYGIYLFNNIIVFAVQIFLFTDFFDSEKYKYVGYHFVSFLACAFGSALLSVISYVFVERPFMDLRDWSKFRNSTETVVKWSDRSCLSCCCSKEVDYESIESSASSRRSDQTP